MKRNRDERGGVEGGRKDGMEEIEGIRIKRGVKGGEREEEKGKETEMRGGKAEGEEEGKGKRGVRMREKDRR